MTGWWRRGVMKINDMLAVAVCGATCRCKIIGGLADTFSGSECGSLGGFSRAMSDLESTCSSRSCSSCASHLLTQLCNTQTHRCLQVPEIPFDTFSVIILTISTLVTPLC